MNDDEQQKNKENEKKDNINSNDDNTILEKNNKGKNIENLNEDKGKPNENEKKSKELSKKQNNKKKNSNYFGNKEKKKIIESNNNIRDIINFSNEKIEKNQIEEENKAQIKNKKENLEQNEKNKSQVENKEQKNNFKENLEQKKFKNNKFELKYDLMLDDLKKKDEIIKYLKNEIEIVNKKTKEEKLYFNEEINKLKENNKNEINSLRKFFEKEIYLLKEEILKINNNKNDSKENKQFQIRKKDFDLIKDDLNGLNEKYTKFEKVFDNKLEFIESSLSKLLQKEEKENKKLAENKNNNNNKVLNDINIIEGFLDKDWRAFKKLLDIIFSTNNSKVIKIDDLNKLKNIALNYKNNNNQLPLEQFNIYIRDIISKITQDETLRNIVFKKSIIVDIFSQLENQTDFNLNQKKEEQKGPSKILQIADKNNSLKNFDIKEFRKEFNLSEKEFPDEIINKEFISCNGVKSLMICNLSGIKWP